MSETTGRDEIITESKVTLAPNIWYVPGTSSKEVPAYVSSAFAPSVAIERADEIFKPAELIVFSSPACSHCPDMVSAAVSLAVSNPRVQTYVVDVQGNLELANRFQVKSVPTTLLDRGLSWTGVLSTAELLSRILSRGGADFEESVFRSMIEDGRIADAAARLQTSAGLTAFSRVWLRSTTAIRIGMMVVAEDVLGNQASALDDSVLTLVAGTKSEDAALRGDTADLLGQIGLSSAETAIRSLLGDPNPDVAEIASEALDAIGQRNSG